MLSKYLLKERKKGRQKEKKEERKGKREGEGEKEGGREGGREEGRHLWHIKKIYKPITITLDVGKCPGFGVKQKSQFLSCDLTL